MIHLIISASSQAYAYIDPGTGSYLWQLLIAGFLGALFTFKSLFKKLWHQISKVFKGKNSH